MGVSVNGKPAVSKTATGGSSPSTPAFASPKLCYRRAKASPARLTRQSYGEAKPANRLPKKYSLMYYVYILKCNNDRLYIGCTNDLKDRIERHKKGEVAATRKRLPFTLLNYFAFSNKYTAYNCPHIWRLKCGSCFVRVVVGLCIQGS